MPEHLDPWTAEALHRHFTEVARLHEELSRTRYNELLAQIDANRMAIRERADQVQQSNLHWQENANKWRELLTNRERDFFPRNLGYVVMLGTLGLLALNIWKIFH